tara:strand:- start:141 stop:437 length:297 start_codon:yes stop_codon:yes gene_type:complete
MKFIKIINQKKFVLISAFLFFYIVFNLLDGERGLISYYNKQKIKKQLIQEKNSLVVKLAFIEKKNSLLTDTIDLDYLEMLYREKFMVGKKDEQIYKID